LATKDKGGGKTAKKRSQQSLKEKRATKKQKRATNRAASQTSIQG